MVSRRTVHSGGCCFSRTFSCAVSLRKPSGTGSWSRLCRSALLGAFLHVCCCEQLTLARSRLLPGGIPICCAHLIRQSEAGSAVRTSRLAPRMRLGSPHQTRQRSQARCRFLCETPAGRWSCSRHCSCTLCPQIILFLTSSLPLPQPPFKCLIEDMKGLKIWKGLKNRFKVYLVTNAVYTIVKI